MAKKTKSVEPEKIVYAPVQPQPITETIEKNYMPYVMSVIISRAIPEIDGLKPSHRKLLTLCTRWACSPATAQRVPT